MALEGKNKHYHWHTIVRRHFLSTAKLSRFSVEKADEIITRLLLRVEDVINTVSEKLPKEELKTITKIEKVDYQGVVAHKISK